MGMAEEQILELYRNDREMIADAFDRVVVNLFRENQARGHRTFAICSCNAGVGSTSIAMELAISLAVSGWKTALVDGDLRKENRYKRLNQRARCGLSDYILQPIGLDDILSQTNWPGLHYVACGHQEYDTPVKLLCSQRMGELMARLKENFDFVIFDVPALNSAVDATIVGAKADCAFLVTASGETKFHDLETAKKQLEEAGANIAGVILNKVSLDDYGYYMHDYNYFSDREYLKRSRYFKQREREKNPKRRRSALSFLRQLMGCLMVVCLLASMCIPGALAEQAGGSEAATGLQENSSAPVVMLDSYRIDGEIAPGRQFTLSLRVKNMDPTRDVRQLRIGLFLQNNGIYLANGETNQRYLEQLRAGKSYNCEYELRALDALSAETLPIELRFDYASELGDSTNSVTISPAVGKDCKIDVISLVTPESAIIGANALFSIQYQNSGTAKLNSLKMRIRGNIVTNNQEIDLKIPEPGRQEYMESSIAFTDTGTQGLDVYITYEDEDGVQHELEPQHVVTNVMSYSDGRTIYGTDDAWDDENKHLVKRKGFADVMQKIETEYSWAVWIGAGLLLLNCVWQIIRWRRRARGAEGRRRK